MMVVEFRNSAFPVSLSGVRSDAEFVVEGVGWMG